MEGLLFIMVDLFNTPIDSPLIIVLTIIFAFTSSITTFDKRLIQAQRDGRLSENEAMLPTWVGALVWFHWLVGLSIILLNWKYAIVVFVIKFILSVLPVLETIGNILMLPFRHKHKIN